MRAFAALGGLTGRTIKAEAAQYIRVVTAGDVEHAAAPSPTDQADRQRLLDERSAKHARDMRPTLAPVETRTAIDAFHGQIHDAQLNQAIGDRNAELAGDVVVTCARPAQRGINPRRCAGDCRREQRSELALRALPNRATRPCRSQKSTTRKTFTSCMGPRVGKPVPDADWRFLIRAAANVARAFGAVHRTEFVIGDVNQGGVLAGHDATVTLIDCDSFQMEVGGRRFLCTKWVAFAATAIGMMDPFKSIMTY